MAGEASSATGCALCEEKHVTLKSDLCDCLFVLATQAWCNHRRVLHVFRLINKANTCGSITSCWYAWPCCPYQSLQRVPLVPTQPLAQRRALRPSWPPTGYNTVKTFNSYLILLLPLTAPRLAASWVWLFKRVFRKKVDESITTFISYFGK